MTLISSLRAALHSKDVSIKFELNPVLYATIQQYWKDSTREELIERMALLASNQTRGGTQQIGNVVHSQLNALPAPWRDERPELSRRILEKFGL